MLTSAHFYRLVPVVFTAAALILLVLALCAGNKPGVVDAYDIITINTAGLGKGSVNKAVTRTPTAPRTTDSDCDNVSGLLGSECNSLTSGTPGALTPVTNSPGKTRNKPDDIAEPSTQEIHTRDFYSLYAVAVCEGDLMPDGSRDVVQCHSYFSDNEPSTIPYLLTTALNLGDPDNSQSLSSLGLTYPLESALDSLNALLKASAVIFSIGSSLTGLAFLSSIPAVSLSSDDDGMGYKWGVWTNLIFVSLALFFLILGALIAVIGAKVVEGKVNDLGGDIGVTAAAGTNWVALAWAGIALMVVVLLYWAGRAKWLRKVKREEDEEERQQDAAVANGSTVTNRPSYDVPAPPSLPRAPLDRLPLAPLVRVPLHPGPPSPPSESSAPTPSRR